MLRNLFVREEDDCLVVGSGLFPEWLSSDQDLIFGPTPTPHGKVTVKISGSSADRSLMIDSDCGLDPPHVVVKIPGFETFTVNNYVKSYP
jgi:hypothetical protein